MYKFVDELIKLKVGRYKKNSKSNIDDSLVNQYILSI